MKNKLLKRILLVSFLLLAAGLAIYLLRPIKTTKPTPASKAINSIRTAAGTNIIIYVLDAARPDHFGCYGYPRPTTPNIDRLAKASLVFEQHYCQYSLTEDSTQALFESRYCVPKKSPSDSPSLVAALQPLGFNTMLFTANPWVLFAAPDGKGFDHVEVELPKLPALRLPQPVLPQKASAGPDNLLAKISRWLAKKPKQPFFTYIHFLPPHIPYDAPQNLKDIFAGKQPPLYWSAPSAMGTAGKKNEGPATALAGSPEETVNLYDANLRWADEAVGKLEQALRKAGLFDNSLLIITADHGESLGEHGYGWHPACPYNEASHIPLIMHFPGKDAPRGRIKALTQTIDLLPTLFDLHNRPYPAVAQGRSLLPLLAGESAGINANSFTAAGPSTKKFQAFVVRDLQSTLLLSHDGKTRALYDTVKDPHQTKNIIQAESQRAAELTEAFRRFALAQPDPPLYFIDPAKRWPVEPDSGQTATQSIPENLKEQLRSIGYLK